MKTLFVVFAACLISQAHLAAADLPKCLGYTDMPVLNDDCISRSGNQTSCLEGFAMRNSKIKTSCIWHQTTTPKITNRQYVSNHGDGLVLSGLNYKDDICSISVRVTLPTSARDRWGGYMRLLGGPGDVTDYSYATSAKVPFTSWSCMVGGRDHPLSCQANITVPKGFSKNVDFYKNSVVFEFFGVGSKLINQWRTNTVLDTATVKLTLDMEGIRCSDPLNRPPPTPAVFDQVLFGPTPFQFNAGPNHYYLFSYRSYQVVNVTGIDYSVQITQSLETSGNTTRLTSMVLKESEFQIWRSKCATTCYPPGGRALGNTLCKGSACSKQVRNLDKNVKYRVLVTYPKISSVEWAGSYSADTPVATPFNKQMVQVEIKPRYWGLTL